MNINKLGFLVMFLITVVVPPTLLGRSTSTSTLMRQGLEDNVVLTVLSLSRSDCASTAIIQAGHGDGYDRLFVSNTAALGISINNYLLDPNTQIEVGKYLNVSDVPNRMSNQVSYFTATGIVPETTTDSLREMLESSLGNDGANSVVFRRFVAMSLCGWSGDGLESRRAFIRESLIRNNRAVVLKDLEVPLETTQVRMWFLPSSGHPLAVKPSISYLSTPSGIPHCPDGLADRVWREPNEGFIPRRVRPKEGKIGGR